MAKGISFAITADDRPAQAALARVGRRLVQVSASGERFAVASRRVLDGTGLPRLAAGFGEVQRRVAGAGESLGRFAPALATLTGAATLAGLGRLVATWGQFGARLGLDAQRIGTSAKNLYGLQGAATLAGSSAEALTDGMRSLGDNLVDAVGGRSPETVAMLSTLGIGFRDASTGGARLATDVLPEIADKIASIRNPALQARAAVALFGGAGEALLPFLRRGSAGIREYNEQAQRYGQVNADGVRAANAMREAQARLGLAAEGVGYAIAERVAPVLVPLLVRLSDWIAAHRDEIAGFFEAVAKRLERWVDGGGIERVTDALGKFGTGVSTVVTVLGGLEPVLEGFFALWLGSKALGALGMMGRMFGAMRGLGLISNPLGAAAAAMGAGGAAAGAMNTPMVDDMGRVIGNWGGAEGERRHGEQSGVTGHAEGRLQAGGTPAPTTAEQTALAKRANDYFIGQGWTPEQAAGLVANIHKESGFNAGAVGDGGMAYGLAQWHPDRRGALNRLTGKPVVGSSFDDQLAAIHAELTSGGERAAGDALRRARTAREAGAIVSRQYERPRAADAEAAERGGGAVEWQRRFAGQPSAPNGVPRTGPMFGPQAPVAPAPLPPSPAAAAGAPGANGVAVVRLEHINPPAGLRTSVQTSGDVAYAGPRIERPQLGNAP